MKAKIVVTIAVTVLIAALLFIGLWKGRYQYEHQGNILVRVNIYTGETCRLIRLPDPNLTPFACIGLSSDVYWSCVGDTPTIQKWGDCSQ